MVTVNIQEAKTHLSRLVERAQAGERITIARAGRPLVELVAIRRSDIVFGGGSGQVVIDDAAFEASDAEVRALWNGDLEVDR